MKNKEKRKIFIICPTYRHDGVNEKLRIYGVSKLVEQVERLRKSKKYEDFDLKLSIVDSSLDVHPRFRDFDNLNNNWLIYSHISDRNNVNQTIKNLFPKSVKFIGSDKDFKNSKKWQTLIAEAVAYDNFFPWEEGYPRVSTIKEQIFRDRPTIGMEKNYAISTLEEKFGRGEVVICTDDDDFRSDDYYLEVINSLKDYDFTRMFKYLTCIIGKDLDSTKWGFLDLSFDCDINNNWLPSKNYLNVELKNHLANNQYKSTVKEKYSKLICLAFTPMGSSGGLHVFKFDLWKKAVKKFGGIPITSDCEDHLFFNRCKSVFDRKFKSVETRVKEASFLRTNFLNNLSVTEWTDDLLEKDVPSWAIAYIRGFFDFLNSDISK